MGVVAFQFILHLIFTCSGSLKQNTLNQIKSGNKNLATWRTELVLLAEALMSFFW